MQMKIRVGIIGAGERGRIAYGRILNSYEDVKIAAIVEQDPNRLAITGAEFGVDKKHLYTDAREFFKDLSKERFVDALVIATYDREHYQIVMDAMDYNLDILLEKPITPDPAELKAIAEKAESYPKIIMVCHVLRYAPLYMKLKDLIDEGTIGDVMSISHNENIGYWHFAHSFVRGNWRNESLSSPLILQKSCHDMDLLLYLTGKKPVNIQAFGDLTYFIDENQPEGASDRCLDCKYQDTCLYSAKDFYKEGFRGYGWRNLIDPALTDETLEEALRTGPYGRCVWACDNDVCDHQSISIEFEDGISAVFNLSAFSRDLHRNIKIQGTLGELEADDRKAQVIMRKFGQDEDIIIDVDAEISFHGGGDSGIIDSFLRGIRGDRSRIRTDINESISSHMMCFAAEKSRKEGMLVDIDDYIASI